MRSLVLVGLEAALVEGPFSIQGEFIRAQTLGSSATEDNVFDGWYVYGSWLPFGDQRPYRESEGLFGRVKPRNEHGALELVLRYSRLDLTDGSTRGGIERNITCGANWYFGPSVRILSSLGLVSTDGDADGSGSLIGRDELEVLTMRLELNI